MAVPVDSGVFPEPAKSRNWDISRSNIRRERYWVRAVRVRAHIIEVQSCTVYIDQNLVRVWFRIRCITRKFNFGWVAELLDHEGTHREGRGFGICRQPLWSSVVSSIYAEALITGRAPAECRSSSVLNGGKQSRLRQSSSSSTRANEIPVFPKSPQPRSHLHCRSVPVHQALCDPQLQVVRSESTGEVSGRRKMFNCDLLTTTTISPRTMPGVTCSGVLAIVWSS